VVTSRIGEGRIGARPTIRRHQPAHRMTVYRASGRRESCPLAMGLSCAQGDSNSHDP
jgi:hypothetical protein